MTEKKQQWKPALRYLKEAQEFAKFPQLAQNWTYQQDARDSRVDWENLDKQCRKNGLSVNPEALIGKEDECEHRCRGVIAFKPVSANLAISEVVCMDCFKILEIRQRRIQTEVLFDLVDTEEEQNEKED